MSAKLYIGAPQGLVPLLWGILDLLLITLNILIKSLLTTFTTGIVFVRQSKQGVASLCFDQNYTKHLE